MGRRYVPEGFNLLILLLLSLYLVIIQEMLRDHDSMSRALMDLYWVPVDKRIEYKLLLYTYKAMHGLAPWVYL